MLEGPVLGPHLCRCQLRGFLGPVQLRRWLCAEARVSSADLIPHHCFNGIAAVAGVLVEGC